MAAIFYSCALALFSCLLCVRVARLPMAARLTADTVLSMLDAIFESDLDVDSDDELFSSGKDRQIDEDARRTGIEPVELGAQEIDEVRPDTDCEAEETDQGSEDREAGEEKVSVFTAVRLSVTPKSCKSRSWSMCFGNQGIVPKHQWYE